MTSYLIVDTDAVIATGSAVAAAMVFAVTRRHHTRRLPAGSGRRRAVARRGRPA
jgi:hypothetical protein